MAKHRVAKGEDSTAQQIAKQRRIPTAEERTQAETQANVEAARKATREAVERARQERGQ